MWTNFMRQLVKFLDPKLEKYREHKPPAPKPKYAPKSLEEFIDVLRRTSKSILNDQERARIAAVMSFEDRTVGELMIPKKNMVFVNEQDMLGPLVLDKLYKSGFTAFPVVNGRDNIKGIVYTEALNALEIKKTDRAEKYMSQNVQYLHARDTLGHAASEIERTNGGVFLVLDSEDKLVGFFTIQLLLNYLLN